MEYSSNILQNPSNILKQNSSTIMPNPFIPNVQRIKELETLDEDANKIILEAYNKNRVNSIANLSLRDILKNISSSFTGFLDDLYVKPNDVKWIDYLRQIIIKDQRYAYLGVFLILISIYFLMIF